MPDLSSPIRFDGRPQRARASHGGFTLIEILVALAIAVLSLTVIMRILSTGLGGMSDAEAHRRAVLWAQSLLDGLSAGGPLRDGRETGVADGRFRWVVSVDPAPQGPHEGTPALPLRAYRVRADVAWTGPRGEESVSLTTLRLQPIAVEAP